jgi:tetratricopeptide (TPR) repeat protein
VRVLLAVLLVTATAPAVRSQADRQAESPKLDRVDLLAVWLDAIDRHRAGATDSLRVVAAWSPRELRLLREHFQALVRLIRDPEVETFFHDVPGSSARRRATQYSDLELTRLRALANAHGAVPAADKCPGEPAGAGRGTNGANHFLKRAAMLHLDAAVALANDPAMGFQSQAPADSPFMMKVDDGRSMGAIGAVNHLEVARDLLDRVAERCSDRPAPSRDAWIGDWYAASLAHQLTTQQFDVRHVIRALDLFPDDADMLALAGATHEALSTPLMQSAIGNDRDLRDRVRVRSQAGELERAEELLQKAIQRNERLAEARLRLANVLGLRGKHDEAVRHLERTVADAGDDRQLAYYAYLLHGRELEATGKGREAQAAYEQAARLYGTARAPRMAISQLLMASGDQAAAMTILERLVRDETAEDPWWEYHAAAGRSFERRVGALRAGTPPLLRP